MCFSNPMYKKNGRDIHFRFASKFISAKPWPLHVISVTSPDCKRCCHGNQRQKAIKTQGRKHSPVRCTRVCVIGASLRSQSTEGNWLPSCPTVLASLGGISAIPVVSYLCCLSNWIVYLRSAICAACVRLGLNTARREEKLIYVSRAIWLSIVRSSDTLCS